MQHRLLLFAIVSLAALCQPLCDSAACAEERPNAITPIAVTLGRKVDFSKDVSPFLDANCTACHNSVIDEGRLSLETREAMLKGGRNGPAVVPGQPDSSRILQLATHRQDPVMPPVDNDVEARNLTPVELGLLRQWIIEGASVEPVSTTESIEWQAVPERLQAVHSVALSPRGEWAAAGRSNQVWIYSLRGDQGIRLTDPLLGTYTVDGKLLYPHGAAHRDFVESLAFSPDGQRLATGSYRSVKIWKQAGQGVVQQQIAKEITGPVAVSQDGRFLTIAKGRKLSLFTLKPAGELGPPTATIELSEEPSDSSEVHRVTVASSDGGDQSVIWAATGKYLWKWQPAQQKVSLVGKLFLTPDRTSDQEGKAVLDEFGHVELRSPESSNELDGRDISPVVALTADFAAIPGRSDQLLIGGPRRDARRFESSSRQSLQVFDWEPDEPAGSGDKSVTAVSVANDAKTVGIGYSDGAVRLLESSSGKVLLQHARPLNHDEKVAAAAEDLEWRKQIAAVAAGKLEDDRSALEDRRRLLADVQNTIPAAEKQLAEAESALKSAEPGKAADEARKRIEDIQRALETAQRSLQFANEAVAKMQSRFDVQSTVKGSADALVAEAEATMVAAKQASETATPVMSLCFSVDGRRYAVLYQDGTLEVRTSTSGQGHAVPLKSAVRSVLAFENDRVLILSAEGNLEWVGVASRWQFDMVLGPSPENPLDTTNSPIAHRVQSLAFSPDGRYLVTGGGEPSRSGELIFWNLADRSIARRMPDAHSDTVQSVTFSRDGKLLATASTDKFAKLFNAATGEPLFSLEGHTDHVLGVAIRANGGEVATTSADKTMKLWDVQTGEQKRTIAAHDKQATAVAFIGLTDQVASSGGDSRVQIHRTSNGSNIRTLFEPRDFVHAVAVSRDGEKLVAGDEEGTVFVWNALSGALLHSFRPQPLSGK